MPDCPALAEAHAVVLGPCPIAQPPHDILSFWDAPFHPAHKLSMLTMANSHQTALDRVRN